MSIAWTGKLQTVRAKSTCESEYVAIYDTIRLCQMQGYLQWHIEASGQPLLFSDNQSALALSKTTLTSKRSKHIELRFHEIRDHQDRLAYVPTHRNLADPLTKGISPIELFEHALALSAEEEDFDDDDEYYVQQPSLGV